MTEQIPTSAPSGRLGSPSGSTPISSAAPMGAPPALALRGLAKRFDGKVAVAGVDLDVPAGSFFGLLGPNGAGKTTTLSMAVGLLRPDAGAAFVLGANVWASPVEAKRRLGVLPDGVRMFEAFAAYCIIGNLRIRSGPGGVGRARTPPAWRG